MKTKHSKGKWEIRGSLDRLEVISKNPKYDNVCDRVTLITNWDIRLPNYEKSKANAKLITAAPELLEALIELHDECIINDMNLPEILKAKRAIKKAT